MRRVLRLLPLLAAGALVAAAIPLRGTAAGNLTNLESDELQTSYSLLSQEFYKKVEPQATLDGARSNLVAYLNHLGVKRVALPKLRASADPQTDELALEREVSAAARTYGTKVGSRSLTYAAIAGMLGSVHDKYTVFLSPKEYAALNEGLDGGNFSGVGIAIQVDDKTKTLDVGEVIPGGPAEKAGVQPGDVIVSVDGKPTKGLTTDQDSKMLRGPKGTQVQLEIQRDGATVAPITITRDTIHQPSVYSRMLPGTGIGYARLTVFGADTASELSAALSRLQDQGAKAYVLDLRDNGGGYLNAAVAVSSKFISSGPIVSVEDRGGHNTQLVAEDDAVSPKPLAVLVNKYTASASEITSGAIQDDGVGELIGEKTYGKGVVQTIHPLPDGSAVKITTARYLTPNGHDINHIGITPDIIAIEPKTARLGDPTSDVQLRSAIGYLQGKIAQTGTSGT